MKIKHSLKIMFFVLFLFSGMSAFGQTTITFTDNGGTTPFTIGGIVFTFGGTPSPTWNAANGGYMLAASEANWIEFSLTDPGTMKAYKTANYTSGTISMRYSTDNGVNWTAPVTATSTQYINTPGIVLFQFYSNKTSSPCIASFEYTTINVASKFNLLMEQGNLYETNRILYFIIKAIGDNLVNGTYSNGAEVAATYKISKGGVDVIAPTAIPLVKSSYTLIVDNTKITTAGDYVLTITDDLASLPPITHNFTVAEKLSTPVVEWDFYTMANVNTVSPTQVFVPTASDANNTLKNTFYGSDGGVLKCGTSYLRADTTINKVVDATHFTITNYGLQTSGINTTGATNLKVFASLDGSGSASPDKVTLSYSTDSLTFIPVGTLNAGLPGDPVGTGLSLPVGAENQPKLFLNFTTTPDAGLLDPTQVVAGDYGHQRYYSIFVSKSSGVSIHGPKASASFFKIYPNPARDIVNVVVKEKSDIYLMDIIGRKLTTLKNAYGEVKIPLNNCAKGYYFIKVNSALNSGVSKLLVQ